VSSENNADGRFNPFTWWVFDRTLWVIGRIVRCSDLLIKRGTVSKKIWNIRDRRGLGGDARDVDGGARRVSVSKMSSCDAATVRSALISNEPFWRIWTNIIRVVRNASDPPFLMVVIKNKVFVPSNSRKGSRDQTGESE
jgi:hypothetical protein